MTELFRSTGRLGAAAAIALALTGQVLAQAAEGGGWFPFKFPGLTTGSVAPSAPLPPASATPGSPPEWSGESGSSGHPLMTADAIRAAAADFHACLEGLWPEAARRGVTRVLFDAQTAALTPDLRIMDLLDAQPEFTKAIWDYLDLLVSDDRIKNGRAILAQHHAIFDAVEKAYGVDRHVITAIWGVESNYGTQVGQRPVVRSTATLACVGRRQDYFREEFLSALEILAHGDRGRGRSARPNSCPRASRNTRSISTATAAATWSIRSRI
jgi:membrane-bound lytic murein transglycosylase B